MGERHGSTILFVCLCKIRIFLSIYLSIYLTIYFISSDLLLLSSYPTIYFISSHLILSIYLSNHLFHIILSFAIIYLSNHLFHLIVSYLSILSIQTIYFISSHLFYLSIYLTIYSTSSYLLLLSISPPTTPGKCTIPCVLACHSSRVILGSPFPDEPRTPFPVLLVVPSLPTGDRRAREPPDDGERERGSGWAPEPW